MLHVNVIPNWRQSKFGSICSKNNLGWVVSLIQIFLYDETHQILTIVTRLGVLLHILKLFKACGNNYLAQIATIFRQFLYRYQNL